MGRMLEAFSYDLRHAVRQLAGAPALTLVASGSIAVGIAVAVGAFSLINSVLWKPLPVPDADDIVHVYTRIYPREFASGIFFGSWTYPNYENFARSGVFSGLAAQSAHRGLSVAPQQGPVSREYLRFISRSYFSVLGLPLLVGHAPADDQPEIVVSHRYWISHLGGDAAVLGQVLRIEGVDAMVVAVAPEKFRGVGRPIAGWASVSLWPTLSGDSEILTEAGARGNLSAELFSLVGRLAEGQTFASAQERLNTLVAGMFEAEPDSWLDRGGGRRTVLLLTHRQSIAPPGQRGELVASVTLTTALVTLLLVLVCTNVAGLLIARALARRREVSVRLALGASRRRILLQMLTESLLLALVGGALGMLALQVLVRLSSGLVFLQPFDLDPDGRVVLTALLLCAVCALLFGAAPALHAMRTDLRSGLGAPMATGERSRMRGLLIASQVAASFLLIFLGVSAARTVRSELGRDLAVSLDGVFAGEIRTPRAVAVDQERRDLFVTELLDLVSGTPGVRAATTSYATPFGWLLPTQIVLSDGTQGQVRWNAVGTGYFEALGIRSASGRVFDAIDRKGSQSVVVVNEAFIRAFPQTGLGTSLEVESSDTRWVIVGIIPDALLTLEHGPARPLVYLPATQLSIPAGSTLIVAVARGAAGSLASELRPRIRERFPEVAAPDLRPLHDLLAAELSPQRITSRVALGVGVIELVLAAAGLYGLCLVALMGKRREVGIRLALGATPYKAGWAVVRSGLLYASMGAGLGLMMGAPTMTVATYALPGLGATDLVALVVTSAVVTAAALLAAWVPARHAARVQPGAALRED